MSRATNTFTSQYRDNDISGGIVQFGDHYGPSYSYCTYLLYIDQEVFLVDLSLDGSNNQNEVILDLSRQSAKFDYGLHLANVPQIVEGGFIGRGADVEQLCEWLTPQTAPPSQRVVAIVGTGGMGKTQLSVKYAKQHQDRYSSIFWLNAKDEFTLKHDFVKLSKIVINGAQAMSTVPINEELVVEQVHQWLSCSGNHRWLLIFDNYDHPKLPGVKSPTGYDIRRYFPSRSQGSILITTRSNRLTFARQLKLAKLQDVNESIKILNSRSGRDLNSGERVLIFLAPLPKLT